MVRFSSVPVVFHESVSQHSFWVAAYAVMIGRALGEPGPVVGALAAEAIVHDMAECVTGDVVRTFKYSTPELKAAVDGAEDRLVGGLPDEVRDLFAAARELVPDGSSERVREIVKAADWLSLFQYMRREAARSNWDIIPYYRRMQDDLCQVWEKHGGDLKGLYWAMINESNAVANDVFGTSHRSDGPRWVRKV